jgi:DNA-binding NarL/FixJ family response regulator
MKPITVLLADDNALVREEYRKLLEHEVDIEIVGEAKNGRQAVDMALNLRPEVVLMDILMPVLNGFQATREILEVTPHIKVLIFSAYNDESYIEETLHAGAMGYLIKQFSLDLVCPAIREAHRGNRYFPSVPNHVYRLPSTVA